MNEVPILIDCTETPPEACRNGVVSIGNFDGVHAGHCRLLARLRHRARAMGVRAIAVSFEPHPFHILRPDRAPPALAWPERKVELLRAAGVDDVVLYRTSRDLLELSARAFFQEIVLDKLGAKGMVEGRDFGFGKGREGNVDSLQSMCREAGIALDVVEMRQGDGYPVSSTRIRAALADGDPLQARDMLGRPHRVRGTVVHGDHRGRTIGFPTANLAKVQGLLPAEGVYACRVWRQGMPFAAAANVGPNPTFGVLERKFEAHVLDFSGDLYGETLDVDFLAHLRTVHPFKDLEALRAQLSLDIAIARTACGQDPPRKNPAAAELSRTIIEWLRQEVEPSLKPIHGELANAELDAEGTLFVDWRLPRHPIPSDIFELLMRLESRVCSVFGEVRHVQSTAPRNPLSEHQ